MRMTGRRVAGAAHGWTRRGFLLSAAAGAGLTSAWTSRAAAQGTTRRRHVGYISVRRDNRITIFTMDPQTGRLTFHDPVELEGGPDPMAMDPRTQFLYVACRERRQIASYRIDPKTGGLTRIGTVPLEGEPIQIVTDRTGRFLLSIHFYERKLGVHVIGRDGAVAGAPIEWRDTATACHGVEVDPSNRFVFVPHVARAGGPNGVAQYVFDQTTGHLTPNTPPFLSLHENQGPRHLLVHPKLPVAYSADEQGCSATAYRLDASAGTLAHLQTISTAPAGYKPQTEITCSELQFSPDGRFLFVVTREHNSIASFAIDAASGRLAAAGRVPTEPDVRPLCLDPDGRFAIAAGSGAAGSGGAAAAKGGPQGRLVTYSVNRGSGQLSPLEVYPGGDGPMWILMRTLSA
jgi:6-phosphogluconolactonase